MYTPPHPPEFFDCTGGWVVQSCTNLLLLILFPYECVNYFLHLKIKICDSTELK